MRQLVQHIRSGQSEVIEVPAPIVTPGRVLVQVSASLVSAGTERMVVDFAEKNLLQKARSRPDLVRQTLDKARREGVLSTLDAVRNRLDQPMALGYSCAGVVLEAGAGVTHVKAGDWVACAGGGFAVHAEIVNVPKNLVVRLKPPSESDPAAFAVARERVLESGAFSTIGAIALQGVRLADCKIGEVIAVIGLGLLGQLTVQLLKTAGCIVLGTDPNPARVELARKMGADAAESDLSRFASLVSEHTAGHGADAVLITADTRSDQPVALAGELARPKGIVVAVGAVGMNIPRKVYYEKELNFQISRSYGPGRYDSEYEEQGRDYPYAYVRWTEQRNMQAFAHLAATGAIDVSGLITHRFPIERATESYDVITGKTAEPFLGVLIRYPENAFPVRTVMVNQDALPVSSAGRATPSGVRLGLLGAGLFVNATLLPAIKASIPDADLISVVSAGGLTAKHVAQKYGFRTAASDERELLANPDVNTIVIATRHDQHARQAIAALQAGKHVYCEKPLCLTDDELDQISAVYADTVRQGHGQMLMVGFNRRFAPFVERLKSAFAGTSEPLMISIRVNAGYIPRSHWVHDPQQGGGRLIGEGCHFVDLACHLAGSTVAEVIARALPDNDRYAQDNFAISISFANGSHATVTYVSNGDKSFSKEYVEVFGGGIAASMDDYRSLIIHNNGRRLAYRERLRPDKGHRGEWRALGKSVVLGGQAPIEFAEILQSMRATFAAKACLSS